MRVDGDAAFRTRQAAHSAARESPNILAWGSADALLDGLLAGERGEPLQGPSATSRRCVPSPGCIMTAEQRSALRSALIAPPHSRSLRYAGQSSIPRSWVSPTPIFYCLGLRCAAHGAHWRPGRGSPPATPAWSPPLRAIAHHFRRY